MRSSLASSKLYRVSLEFLKEDGASANGAAAAPPPDAASAILGRDFPGLNSEKDESASAPPRGLCPMGGVGFRIVHPSKDIELLFFPAAGPRHFSKNKSIQP